MLSTHISISSQAILSAPSSLAPSSALLQSTRRFRHRSRLGQQSRAFRFGLWSSYIDPTFQKELRHRHRVEKHKYLEAVNRKLSWDHHQLPSYIKHVGLKRFMCSAWHKREPRGGAKSPNLDSYENNSKPRQSEREVDRHGNLDRHLPYSPFSWEDRMNGRWRVIDASLRRAGFDHLYAMDDSQTAPKTQQPSPVAPEHHAPPPNQVYEIDPITNRKVFKNPTAKQDSTSHQSIPLPVKTFRGYISQLDESEPPTSHETAKESGKTAEAHRQFVDRNRQTRDPATTPLERAPSATQTLNQVKENISHASPKSTQQSTEKDEVLDDDYSRYDAKYMYTKPFMAYEPDGKAPTLERETPDPVEEGYKAYDQRVSQEKQNSPLMSKSSTNGKAAHLRAIWKGDDYFTRQIGEKHRSQVIENMINKPEDKMEHDGFQEVKPTPQPKSTEECLKTYDSKVSYNKPFLAYEDNDGKSPTLENEAPDPVEKGYKAYDAKMSYEKPFLAYEANDGKAPTLGKETPDPVEEGYKAYDSQHPYGAVRHNESNGKPEAKDAVQNGLREYDSRVSYSPKPSDQQSKYQKLFSSISDEKPIQSRDELRAEVKANEPSFTSLETKLEGLNKRENLEQQFNTIQSPQSRAWEKLWFEGVKNPKSPLAKPCAEPETLDRALDEATRDPSSSLGKTSDHGKLAKDAATPGLLSTKITGSFVRDFPEETDIKWTADNSNSLLPNKPSSAEVESKVQNAEKEYSDGLALQENHFRKPHTPRLQPALDRTSTASATPPGSSSTSTQSKVQGESHLSAQRSTTISRNGKNNKVDLNTSELSRSTLDLPSKTLSPSKTEPTLYRILAYDPTMQSISTAETTSFTPDTSSFSPLTPAEVLLRLSNPAKFFPYLTSLQEEGYEIASGAGDVLVFRKVRDGKIAKVARRNPIDGMQAPPTGNFASPTGFVNYDSHISDAASESTTSHQSSEDVGKERFKSGIDVRREEPVFSGRRNSDEGRNERKRGRGKRLLIGAIWVGACSYAVGVMAEFFKT